MKYNDDGTIKEIKVKAFDTLPVGAEVDYNGETVPDGWTEVDDVETGTIPITDTTHISGSAFSYVKVGRILQITCDFQIKSSYSGNWKFPIIAKLPEHLKPMMTSNISLVRDGDNNTILFSVIRNGDIQISDRGRGNLSASAYSSYYGTIFCLLEN